MMKMIKLFYLVFILGTCFSVTAQESPRNSADGIRAKAFDFWEGKWEVSWQGKDSLEYGKNEIKRILDGKVLQEFFEDNSGRFKGTSLTVFNPRTNQWHQAWADSNGDFYNFKGIITEDNRTFITEKPDDSGNLFKMEFTNIQPDSFDWTWSGSKDGGATWLSMWKIKYKRLGG